MNYLSQEYRITNPPSSVDIGMVEKTLDTLQNSYNRNKAETEQTLALYNANLKSLRPEDDIYIAGRLAQVKTTIDQYKQKNPNLAYASNKDSIMSAITSLMDDPLIQDAVSSRAVKSVFDTQMAKKQEKGDGSYNDLNYRDALEQGGLNDYMAGKTKKLTGFTYSDFVDVPATLAEKAQKHAKEFGLEERYLGTDTSNPYFYSDKYGKVMTQSELYGMLKSTLTDKEKNQMAINTRQTLGKYDDNSYTEVAKDYYTSSLTATKEALATVEAEKKSKGTTEYDGIISEYKAEISKIENTIKDPIIKDRSDMLNIYANDMIKNISSAYDFSFISKINRDDTPFQVMKWESDTLLKIRDLEAKEKANKLTEQSMGGTPLSRPALPEESELTDVQKTQKSLSSSKSAFEQYLNENVDGFSSKSESEKYTYMKSFNPSDNSIKGNKETTQVLYDEFMYSHNAFKSLVDDSEKAVTDKVRQSFNDLTEGGKANLGNLAITMPLTSQVVQNKKGVKFESLTKYTQAALVAEWASNKLQHDTPDDKDVESMYRNVVIRNKGLLKRANTADSKRLLGKIQESTKYNESLGSGNPFRTIPQHLNLVGSATKQALDRVAIGTTWVWNRLFEGEAYANENYKKDEAVEQVDMDRIRKNYDKAGKAQIGIWQEDVTIEDLDAQDLAVRNGKTSQHTGESFSYLDTKLSENIRKKAASFQPNIKEYKAFNFSPAIKEQAQTAEQLKQVVIDAGGAVPDKGSGMTVFREGSSWRVSYVSGEEQTSHLVPKIDQSIVGMIDTSKVNWLKDPKNPHAILTPQVFKPIADPRETDNRVKAFVENVGESGILPPQVLQNMLNNPANTPLASVPDYINRIKKDSSLGADFYNKNKADIHYILSTPYTVIPYSNGESFRMKIEYRNPDKTIGIFYPDVSFSEKDNTRMYMSYLEEVEKLKLQLIQERKLKIQ